MNIDRFHEIRNELIREYGVLGWSIRNGRTIGHIARLLPPEFDVSRWLSNFEWYHSATHQCSVCKGFYKVPLIHMYPKGALEDPTAWQFECNECVHVRNALLDMEVHSEK